MVLLTLLACHKCFIEFPKGYTYGGKVPTKRREASWQKIDAGETRRRAVAKDDPPLRLGACRT